jgi:peptide/nickel transport system permease protein
MPGWSRSAVSLVGQLALLLFATLTLLFFLVRLTGDPAVALSGDSTDPAVLDAIRAQYGLDRPLWVQYLIYLQSVLFLDLGESWVSGRSALDVALERMPATLLLAGAGMLANLAIAIPIGVFLGTHRAPKLRKLVDVLIFIAQGIPGYVVALFLIQWFVVEWRLLPSAGNAGLASLVLPALTIASFLAPKLARVIAVNVSDALKEEYAVMARAQGAGYGRVVFGHALPNAMLGATALIGAQIAGLVNGIIITETIFAWPGVGRLLLDSVLLLDFPVVQSVVLVTTVFVFMTNWAADRMIEYLDPRLREH